MNQSLGLLLGTIWLLASITIGQEPSKAERISIMEEPEHYVLTVPVSRLVMRIPKAGLSKGKNPGGGSANSPRYFYLENQALHLIISGWFEPERGFKGVEDFWAAETADWKRLNRPEAQNVSFEKLGSWNAILYDIPITGAKNSHIRAHWVHSGTWIDVHLSLTADPSAPDLRPKLRDLVKAIEVSEKKS